MAQASFRGAFSCALLSLVLGGIDLGALPVGFYPRFTPFFFLCTHHGEAEQTWVAEGGGKMLLTLQISNNPAAYIPGQKYTVTISTSSFFDGLLVTGLYTSTTVQAAHIASPASLGFGVMPRQKYGTQFVCSVLASQVSHLPTTSLSFTWIAPPSGTGCINILVTAMLRGEITFKDTLAKQLCELEVATEPPLQPSLAEIHGNPAVLRDDFDSDLQELDARIWSNCSNCEVGEQCGVLLNGKAVTFCEPFGERELITVALNSSTASILQFALGSGSCRFSYSDPSITVSYRLSNSSDWNILEKIRAPTNSSTVVHLLTLPPSSKKEAVQLRWSQEAPLKPNGYETCWGLDNILLVNMDHKPTLMEDNFDPLDTANWIFFPGATVKHACQSDGSAMYFHGEDGVGHSYTSTRNIDLHRKETHRYWKEDFESPLIGVCSLDARFEL